MSDDLGGEIAALREMAMELTRRALARDGYEGELRFRLGRVAQHLLLAEDAETARLQAAALQTVGGTR